MELKTSDAEVFDGELHIDRISRGVFGISGNLNVKQPIDDRTFGEVIIYRDTFCNKNYIIQPYGLGNKTISEIMNNHYKLFLMDTLKECAENAPYSERFAKPFGPFHILLNKCQLSTENLPSQMNDGCYKIQVKFYGQVEINLTMYSIIDNEY